MPIKRILLIAVSLLALAADAARADIVILKSGEMFQTRKAWKEGGVVSYYRNGRIVQVAEKDVERLIQAPRPDENQPSSRLPTTAPSPPSGNEAPANGLPGPELPTGDNTGYLGLKWGQAPSEIEGLAFVTTDPAYGGVRQYTRPHAKARFGRASVDNVFYGFWQDGLYTILIEVSNYLDFMDLKAEAFRRYGEINSLSDHPERFSWKSKGSDRQLAFDPQSGTGYLWMRSQALHAKVKARYPE